MLTEQTEQWAIENNYFVYDVYEDKRVCASNFLYLKKHGKSGSRIRIRYAKGMYVWGRYFSQAFIGGGCDQLERKFALGGR